MFNEMINVGLSEVNEEFQIRCVNRLCYLFPEFRFGFGQKVLKIESSKELTSQQKQEILFIVENERLAAKFEELRLQILKDVYGL